MYKSEFRQFLIYYKRIQQLVSEEFSKDFKRIFIQGGRIFGEDSEGALIDLTDKILTNLQEDDIIF